MEFFRSPGTRKLEREMQVLEKFEKTMPPRPSMAPGIFELQANLVERAKEHSYRSTDNTYRLVIVLLWVLGIPYMIGSGAAFAQALPEHAQSGAFMIWLLVGMLLLFRFMIGVGNANERDRKLLDKQREHWLNTGKYPAPGEVTLPPDPPTRWQEKKALWKERFTRKKHRSVAEESEQPEGDRETADDSVAETVVESKDPAPPAAS